MAFIVWRRGRYAELVHSVRSGHSVRQLRLAWIGARPAITPALRAQVAAAHPHIHVDWDQISAALAQHPLPPEPAPDADRFNQLVAATAEPVLHDWLTRYHRRIRRERVTTVESQWWPEFRSSLLTRPDLPDLLLHPPLLDQAASAAVDAAEAHHLARLRAQQQAAARAVAAQRALLSAAVDAALAAVRAEYSHGLQWACDLLGYYPPGDPRASDPAFLAARAAPAIADGSLSPADADRAISLLLAAASAPRLPRLWDGLLDRLPPDTPPDLIHARSLAAGSPPERARRDAQVLLNLLDTRRREHTPRHP